MATTMKFRAHETFFIRKGWLSKGMKCVNARNDVFVAKDENPMDVLGLGSNMVKSLRYWLQAVGLTEEPRSGRRFQTITPFGQSVFNNDRYIEELGTLYASMSLDEKKLRRMLNRIYHLERQNSKTEKMTEKKMKEEIQRIIEEEADKCY